MSLGLTCCPNGLGIINGVIGSGGGIVDVGGGVNGFADGVVGGDVRSHDSGV